MEYPRLLHKPNGEHCKVNNEEEKDAAEKDGWTLSPVLTDTQEKAVAKAKADAGEKKPTAKAGAPAASTSSAESITDLNATDAIGLVNAAESKGALTALERAEKANARYPDGRAGVLEAIAARRTALGG